MMRRIDTVCIGVPRGSADARRGGAEGSCVRHAHMRPRPRVPFDEAFRERFAAGLADEREMLEAMADGIRTGEVWRARGYYRRLASTMIDGGWIDSEGRIL